jgi:hypothetical protein
VLHLNTASDKTYEAWIGALERIVAQPGRCGGVWQAG